MAVPLATIKRTFALAPIAVGTRFRVEVFEIPKAQVIPVGRGVKQESVTVALNPFSDVTVAVKFSCPPVAAMDCEEGLTASKTSLMLAVKLAIFGPSAVVPVTCTV